MGTTYRATYRAMYRISLSHVHVPCCGSISLFEPLVPDPSNVVWVAWVKHVEYFKYLTMKSITAAQIIEMDQVGYTSTGQARDASCVTSV